MYKGLETLLEAFELVRTKIKENLILKIAGINKESKIVLLAYNVLKLKRHDTNVFYLGSVNAGVIARELSEADVFVHPSHTDNSPNSVCEAMLVGTPVVSTNVGGIPSLVTNGVDGLLVQDGDPIAMAGAILDVLTDIDLSCSLSVKARSRAKERHDPRHVAQTVISVYSKLTGIEPPAAESTY